MDGSMTNKMFWLAYAGSVRRLDHKLEAQVV